MAKMTAATVARLSLYRRLLGRMAGEGRGDVFSHEIAAAAHVTAAQVRRDLMAVGCFGTPAHGYRVAALLDGLGRLLDAEQADTAVLVGLGNLGRALTAYLARRPVRIALEGIFDNDPRVAGWTVAGLECRPVAEMESFIREREVRIGILTVPAAAAQEVSDALITAGVTGILNFAPTPIRAPDGVFVENMDMLASLEKVAFFARLSQHGFTTRARRTAGRRELRTED